MQMAKHRFRILFFIIAMALSSSNWIKKTKKDITKHYPMLKTMAATHPSRSGLSQMPMSMESSTNRIFAFQQPASNNDGVPITSALPTVYNPVMTNYTNSHQAFKRNDPNKILNTGTSGYNNFQPPSSTLTTNVMPFTSTMSYNTLNSYNTINDYNSFQQLPTNLTSTTVTHPFLNSLDNQESDHAPPPYAFSFTSRNVN